MIVDEELTKLMDQSFKDNREKAEQGRHHLGASSLGKTCPREVWYDFRHVNVEDVSGRTHRLFDRGHKEEDRFIEWLELAGVEVHSHDENGQQYRCTSAHGHSGGSLDSVLVNTPYFGDQPCLGEYKTHNQNSFKSLVSKGLKESKWLHYIQMQIYISAYNLPGGYYFAICKNNDDLHIEIVLPEPLVGNTYANRAYDIVFTESPPPRAAADPSRWVCKFCQHKRICFHGGYPQRPSCRNCEYGYASKASDLGVWGCRLNEEHPDQPQCNLENGQIGYEPKKSILEVD